MLMLADFLTSKPFQAHIKSFHSIFMADGAYQSINLEKNFFTITVQIIEVWKTNVQLIEEVL